MWKALLILKGTDKFWMVEKIIDDCDICIYAEGGKIYTTPYQSEAKELADKLNNNC